MLLNKIQLKALAFKIIEPLRDSSTVDDEAVSKALVELKSIDGADFEFLARLLVKEASYKTQRTSTAFLFLAENLAPDSFMALVMNELTSNLVPDEQKMFFINILSGLGVKFEPEDIGAYLSNPDSAISSETSKFLENAMADPEAQIDFLDFYFSTSLEDRRELINSVIYDFDGDSLVNVLSPLVLSLENPKEVLEYLEIMDERKSLLAVKPLKYLSALNPNSKVSKTASKMLQKMSLSGFYTKEKLGAFYKELLCNFEAPSVQVSLPDGNSNFSFVISRRTKENVYYVLFLALNTEYGPFSCFGFSSITKAEYTTIISRFFNNSKQINIPAQDAKKILETLILKRISLNKIIPYEFYSWQRLMDDVEENEKPLDDILLEGASVCDLSGMVEKLILSPFVQNWFYRYSKTNVSFAKLIDETMCLGEENICEMENLVLNFAKDAWILNNIKTRLKYLVYCLKKAEADDFADMFYSLIFDENTLQEFIVHILKKSIYEHMLNLRLPKRNTNIFKKEKAEEGEDVSLFINYIEENWTE